MEEIASKQKQASKKRLKTCIAKVTPIVFSFFPSLELATAAGMIRQSSIAFSDVTTNGWQDFWRSNRIFLVPARLLFLSSGQVVEMLGSQQIQPEGIEFERHESKTESRKIKDENQQFADAKLAIPTSNLLYVFARVYRRWWDWKLRVDFWSLARNNN